jgi:hypothetical protein
MDVPLKTIQQRLGEVEDTAGSVAACAAWCGLHAFAAHSVIGVWASLISDVATPPAKRAALLHVLHETVVMCVRRGAAEGGAQQLMQQIATQAPKALFTAAASEGKAAGGAQPFAVALREVLDAWLVAKAFPVAWTREIMAKTAQASAAKDGAGAAGRTANVPEELQPVLKAFVKYKASRERLARLEASADPSEDALEALRQEALRRLVPVMKALGDGDASDDAASLLATLRTDQAALRNATDAPADGDQVDPLADLFE